MFKKVIYFIGFLGLCLPVAFFIYKACNVNPSKEKATKEIHIYKSDSGISSLREEMNRIKEDIEYLKRKKPTLTINCIMKKDSVNS